jgi:hypothetical protein
VGHEYGDLLSISLLEFITIIGIPGLHDSHDYCINNVLSLYSNFLAINLVEVILLKQSPILGLGKHKINSDVVVFEDGGDVNFLCKSELVSLHVLLDEDLLFWVEEIE